VRELETQHDQGGDHPVGEHQLVVRAGASGALALMAAAIAQPGLLLRHPRPGQPGDQLAQLATRKASTDTMRQGRAGPSRRHILIVPRGRLSFRDRHAKITSLRWHAAIAHQVVTARRAAYTVQIKCPAAMTAMPPVARDQ
jgi:hypothetical protein